MARVSMERMKAARFIDSQPVKETLCLASPDFNDRGDLTGAALTRIRRFVRLEATALHDTVGIRTDLPFTTRHTEAAVRGMIARLWLLPTRLLGKPGLPWREFSVMVDMNCLHTTGGSFRMKVMRSALVVLFGLPSASVGSEFISGAIKVHDTAA